MNYAAIFERYSKINGLLAFYMAALRAIGPACNIDGKMKEFNGRGTSVPLSLLLLGYYEFSMRCFELMEISASNYLILSLTSFALLGLCAAISRFNAERRGQYRSRAYLFLSSLAISLAMAEAFCANLLHHSDTFRFTLAAKNWEARYWMPINRYGLRDGEWSDERFDDKKIIAVVGDSFAAGAGVENVKNRFSGRLQEFLGSSWEVVTLAEFGWGPNKEHEVLVQFPYKPTITILSYYINDIQDVMSRCGARLRIDIVLPPVLGSWFIYNSHLVNFIYWRWYRYVRQDFGNSYWQSLGEAFDSEKCLKLHFAQIESLVKTAKIKSPHVIAVIFPHLSAIKQSQVWVELAANYFTSLGVPVLSIADHVQYISPSDLVVSSLDSHPNEAVHARVAKLLQRMIVNGNLGQER